MAKITLSLDLSHVRAALLFAAQKDIRFYLQGVLIEAHADRLFIVATDGARVGVFRGAYSGPAVQFIIPRELLDPIKPARGGPASVEVEFTPGEQPQQGAIVVQCGAAQYRGKEVDGRFPEWRRVFPVKTSGEVAQFNAEYLADLAKVAKVLRGGKFLRVDIAHNGSNGARVSVAGCDTFAGVLMPIRTEGPKAAPMMADHEASALIEPYRAPEPAAEPLAA